MTGESLFHLNGGSLAGTWPQQQLEIEDFLLDYSRHRLRWLYWK
jgi:hypothetical protein